MPQNSLSRSIAGAAVRKPCAWSDFWGRHFPCLPAGRFGTFLVSIPRSIAGLKKRKYTREDEVLSVKHEPPNMRALVRRQHRRMQKTKKANTPQKDTGFRIWKMEFGI